MTGRLQNEMTLEMRNDQKVIQMPEFVNGWYLNMKASRKTAATCGDYITKVRHFLQFINPDYQDVTLDDINENSVTKYFLSIQKKVVDDEIFNTSDSYQSTVWCCLDNFLGYLERTGKINQNYIRNIDKPKNHDLERINEHRVLLTMNDFRDILASIDKEPDIELRKRDKALILLFMNTGMRRTAMASVMINDIDFDNQMLVIVDKGNKRHEYVLNNDMVEALHDWLEVRPLLLNRKGINKKDSGHLFISENGSGISGSTIAYTVKKYTEDAIGHAISPHKLRSGYCSILYSKTHDIEFVRRAVGHANAATTQRYIVTKGSEKKKAAEIMGDLL